MHRTTGWTRAMATGAILAAGMAATAADWPRLGGPDGTGVSGEKGLNKAWQSRPPKLAWKAPLTDGGYALLAAAGGKVFVVDHQGNEDIVRAFDLDKGVSAWTYAYRDLSKSNHGFARAAPVVANGKVYTASGGGAIHCLEAASGRMVWTTHLVKDLGGEMPGWYYAGSPLLDGDKLIVYPGGAGGVAALNPETGQALWRGKGGAGEAPGYATPAVATIGGKRQYVLFSSGSVIGVDAANGAPLWKVPWKTAYDVNAATPIVMGNTVFVTSNYGSGCGLIEVAANTARIAWQNKEIQCHFNTPVLLNGLLYSTSDPGRIVCLEPRTGTVKWSRPGFEKGGLLYADGALIVCDGRSGEIAMIEAGPEDGKELGRTTLMREHGEQKDKFWTPPILADGRLLVRTRARLLCLDVR
jgi:outer membrane protein assembly factor BamB